MQRSPLEWLITGLFFTASGCFIGAFFTGDMVWIFTAIGLLIAANLLKFIKPANQDKQKDQS
ncbi:MAG: hypothetical protein HUJ54_11110 [Erysipelotrichaceae bacterium]|nr:hypothetical protein [Erysipelotrichaceae bacterium]